MTIEQQEAYGSLGPHISWLGWHTLWERKWWLLLGIVLGIVLSVTIMLRQRPVYRAECTLEYNPFPARPLGRDIEDVTAPVLRVWKLGEWYETQNEIIQSRAIAARVVKKLGLHQDPDFMRVPRERRHRWKGTTVNEAARVLRSRIEVRRIPDTRIAQIFVEDTDPHRAALLANQVAQEYIERSVEVRLESTLQALKYLDRQLATKSRELAEAELRLHQFKKEANVLSVSLEEQQNHLVQDMHRFSDALAEVRRERIRLESQLAELQRLVKEDPAKAYAPIIDQSPLVQQLRTELSQAKTELAELSARYGDQWPAVKASKARAKKIEDNLRKEILGIISSVASHLREVRASEASLEQTLEQIKRKALNLNLKEIEYRRLSRDQQTKEKLFGLLLERSEETHLTRALHVATASVLDEAQPPKGPIRPKLSTALSTGLLLGSFLGLVLAFLVAALDRTIRDAEDIEKLGLQLLGVVPDIDMIVAKQQGEQASTAAREGGKIAGHQEDGPEPALFVHNHPNSPVSENVRAMRTNLTFMALDRSPKVLGVTSHGPLEGKTTLAASLAISMAQAGRRVLLVDADMRRPRVHRVFRIDQDKGLSTILIGEHDPDEAVVTTQVPRLDVLPCGPIPPNPAELLHHERFASFLSWCRDTYDYTFFDSSPAGLVTDPIAMGARLDGMLLVAKARATAKSELLAIARKLDAVQARIIGVVLNKSQPRSASYGYGYLYGYGESPQTET